MNGRQRSESMKNDKLHNAGKNAEFADPDILKVGKPSIRITVDSNGIINMESEKGIGGLYLIFNAEYGIYSLIDRDTGHSVSAGQYGYLHEYLDTEKLFGAPPSSLSLVFGNGPAALSQIRVFPVGKIPDYVQAWEPPLYGCADMALFSAHGDDEQLFFAGLLPLYAGERHYAVQVIYLTDHGQTEKERIHEMLNGLWAVGVRHYPVFGHFADFMSDSLEKTYAQYEALGTDRDELLRFVVTQIRRFKPKVAVGHDLNGEYGHGMHRIYADLLTKASEISNDETAFPESAEQYGVWKIPKLYLHLYEKNTLVMDYDKPLKAFDGMSAFQVTQKKGYPCHRSQQETWFTSWINGKEQPIEKAAQIGTYSPCRFGLYSASVPVDGTEKDMMENVTPYSAR